MCDGPTLNTVFTVSATTTQILAWHNKIIRICLLDFISRCLFTRLEILSALTINIALVQCQSLVLVCNVIKVH